MTNDLAPDLRLDDLPVTDATRVRLIEAACKWVDAQPAPTRCMEQAAVELSARLAGLAGAAARPVSAKSMERIWYRWKRAGRSWRALVDRRTVAANRCGARTAQRSFRAHLAMLASKHPRSLRGAVRELYEEWRSGASIPGYEGLNYRQGLPLPEGWSEDNLLRCMPDKTALKVMNEGVRAAAAMLPQVYATRAGCWPCSHVLADDVWLDVEVLGYDERGQMQLGRPLQLGMLDLYTGKRLCWGTKLRTKREDGTSTGLNGDEMLCVLCDWLMNVGYSKRGTTLVVENGTATVSREVAETLALLSDGKIRVEYSGKQGMKQVGAFGGRAVGNPRHKAELESWHNLFHNYMDGFISQVGKDRKEPEALWGVREETKRMLRAGEKLPADRALLLAPFVPTMTELCDKLPQIVQAINNRTDHGLEGWAACGNTALEFSMSGREGTWEDVRTLAPDVRQMAQVLAATNPNLVRERNLSPNEAWEKSLADPQNELVRFTPAQCVALLGVARKFALRQKGGAFKLDSRSRHHRQLLFAAEVKQDPRHEHGTLLHPDRQYYGVFNPLNETLLVLDERNRVLGVAPLINRASHVDEAAKLQEFGRVMRARTAELARVENMVAPLTAERETRLAYNKDVRAGRAVDPLGLADERTLRLAHKPAKAAKPALAYVPTEEPDLPDSYEQDTPFS